MIQKILFLSLVISSILFGSNAMSQTPTGPLVPYLWHGHWMPPDIRSEIYNRRQAGTIQFCGTDIDAGAQLFISPQVNPGQDPCAVAADATVGNVDELPMGIGLGYNAAGLWCTGNLTKQGGAWDTQVVFRMYAAGSWIRVGENCTAPVAAALSAGDATGSVSCWNQFGADGLGDAVDPGEVVAIRVDASDDDDVDLAYCIAYVFWDEQW